MNSTDNERRVHWPEAIEEAPWKTGCVHELTWRVNVQHGYMHGLLADVRKTIRTFDEFRSPSIIPTLPEWRSLCEIIFNDRKFGHDRFAIFTGLFRNPKFFQSTDLFRSLGELFRGHETPAYKDQVAFRAAHGIPQACNRGTVSKAEEYLLGNIVLATCGVLGYHHEIKRRPERLQKWAQTFLETTGTTSEENPILFSFYCVFQVMCVFAPKDKHHERFIQSAVLLIKWDGCNLGRKCCKLRRDLDDMLKGMTQHSRWTKVKKEKRCNLV